MFPLTDVKTFNFYRRYKWSEVDFGVLQDTLINFPATVFAELFGDAVINGLNQNGSSSLNANYLAGYAVNSLGNLLAVSSGGSVAVTNNVKSLIVIRPVITNTNPITRPTTPFDTVDLNVEQTAQVVAIAGTISAYPSKVAGDVILFGVTASGGSITQIDESQCELIAKKGELQTAARYNKLVGNHRDCHYLDLASAIAAASTGDRIRVLDSQTLNTTITVSINDIDIEFDPGVTFSNGTAGTGFILSGTGVRLTKGRLTGFTTAVSITGNYSTLFGQRFASNTTDVTDTLGTSQVVAVINE